ncbi:hypothetical protein HJFPF1_05272 [Paramyrothecium foliicola]|nr:hypothetical protein HJFPF1_05272 [Paramyrothecium foliicola]
MAAASYRDSDGKTLFSRFSGSGPDSELEEEVVEHLEQGGLGLMLDGADAAGLDAVGTQLLVLLRPSDEMIPADLVNERPCESGHKT